MDWVSEKLGKIAGVAVLAERRKPLTGDREREILFGRTQYEKR